MAEAGVDISVVVPCLNEEGFIRETIRRLSSQKGSGSEFSYEILLCDGMSKDRTQEIIKAEAAKNPRVRLILNERRITPCAFNLGIQNSRGKYICILGAHSEIDEDYLLRCLETIRKVDADNVGGPWRAKGKGYMGQAIALAFQNPFAVGAAKAHMVNYEGYVDTIWGGFFKREVFDRIGLFDEAFVRGQDAELNLRLIRSGGKIWQSPAIRYFYYCRDSLSNLWKLYTQTGYWKVKVMRKHRQVASLRHLVPGAFVLTLLALAVAAPFNRAALYLLGGIAGLYLFANLVAVLLTCGRLSRIRFLPVMPVIFGIYHFGYTWGFLRGFMRLFILGKGY